MLYTQWNYDDAVEVEREEAYEDGREAGMALGKLIGIAEGRAEGERQVICTFWSAWGDSQRYTPAHRQRRGQ